MCWISTYKHHHLWNNKMARHDNTKASLLLWWIPLERSWPIELHTWQDIKKDNNCSTILTSCCVSELNPYGLRSHLLGQGTPVRWGAGTAKHMMHLATQISNKVNQLCFGGEDQVFSKTNIWGWHLPLGVKTLQVSTVQFHTRRTWTCLQRRRWKFDGFDPSF